MSRRLLSSERGQAMVLAVFAFALLTIIGFTLTDVVTGETQASGEAVASSGAYQAAEAGLNEYISKLLDDSLYYLHWVDEAESTRQSGSVTAGAGSAWTGGITWTYPNGKDNWKVIDGGTYAYNLEITAPSGSGSQEAEAVQILSTGCRWNAAAAACATGAGYAEREVQTSLLPSSAASWQMIANTSISYGSDATTNGRLYANGDITHDGTANADMYADCYSGESGCGTVSGSYTAGTGVVAYDLHSTPSVTQEISSPIDFSTFQTSISDIQRAAETNGVYLSQATPPAAWEIVFNSNGTFTAAACSETGSQVVWDSAPACGTATTYNMPTNGAIYSDQTIVIGSSSASSTVDGRVTVTSGSDIVIGNDISYASGTNSVLGLVADDDMIVAAWVPSVLTWDAATVTETGYWTDANGMASNPPCNGSGSYEGSKSSMTFNGSTATDEGGCMSEFDTRTYDFDSNLLWLDPPWFPTIENPYTVLLQREVPITP